MESAKELRCALEAAQAETAALRAAAEGADRAPRGNDPGDAGEVDSAYRATYDDGYAGTRADGHAGPNARQGANTANFFWGGRNRQVPKFTMNEDEASMWRLRSRAHLDGMGLGYTLDHAVTPVPVKGDQRNLISRYGEQPVQQAQAAWACLLDATAGAALEERVLSAVTVRDARCQILNWTGHSSEAETLFPERQLETVPNYGEEDPNLLFSRVDQLLTRLRSIDVYKTEKQIVNIFVLNFSDHYEIEKRSRLDSPFLRRRDVEHIVRASWATCQMRQVGQRSASGVTPNPHALVASGGFQTTRGGYGGPRRGGGRSSGSRRGIQQSWSRGEGNHHFNRQQQQQQPRPPPKPLRANFGLGGAFDGGTNAGGWPQEESPPSPDSSVPHCERCGRKSHVARICRAPSRFEGICDTCGQYGHRMRYCIRNQPAPHAHVVAAPVAPPASSAPAFSAPPTGGSGYNITTGAYGYGGGDGSYSGGPYDHGEHVDANYEAVPVGQSPGPGAGAGHDIPSRPPGDPDGGYHRAMQQAGNGGDGVAFPAEDGGHEDEGYFGGPFSSVFGGPESGHGPTAYIDANYEAVPVGQSPGPGAGAGHDIPSRPPGDPDGGYHRAMQQAGNGGDGVAFPAEDGGHEDEGYFGGPFSSVFGGPESGHGPTAYILQLPSSGHSSGTGCDILGCPPQYSGRNNGYGTNRGPQQQYGSGSRSYRAKPFVRHYPYSTVAAAAAWPPLFL